MHPQRETVWCGFWYGGIIGPFFSKMSKDVNWPPRSCDWTPLDYFLWGAIEDKFPETIEALKDEIEVAIFMRLNPKKSKMY